MKRSALAALLLCLVLVNVDQGFGQAMIGYGINVGRAGAAGAGAGATGIFRKLSNRMDGNSNPSGHRTARTAQPEFDPKDLENMKAEREEPAYSTSGTVKTEGGVRISGLSSRRASPTRVRYAARPYDYEPTGSGPAATPAPSAAVASQPQPAPAAGDAQIAEATPAAPPATGQAEVEVSAQSQAQSAGPSVLSARQGSSTPTAVDAALTPELRRLLEVDSEIADIAVGTPIEDLIARFGKPLLKMVGLGGEGYSEKYIFRAPDGRRFTVFAQAGVVADIMIEPAQIAAL